MAVTIHGIKTCETMRKARAWLDDNGVDHRFHDYRVEGISEDVLRGWVGAVGWETLLNRSSATFRALAPAEREGLDAEKAMRLMLSEPTMIKRPVLDVDGRLIVGFKPALYEAAFARS